MRATPDAVLVRLDAARPELPAAQVGLVRTRPGAPLPPEGITWLGGLSASDVERLLDSILRCGGRVVPELAGRVLAPEGHQPQRP